MFLYIWNLNESLLMCCGSDAKSIYTPVDFRYGRELCATRMKANRKVNIHRLLVKALSLEEEAET